MVEEISHHDTEGPVVAEGGTLSEKTVFKRDEATLTTNHKLEIPTNRGTYVFTKDRKDSIQADIDNIKSFLVGPIFHLPNDTEGESEMKHLIEKHKVALLVTLFDEDENPHYLHYVLDSVN